MIKLAFDIDDTLTDSFHYFMPYVAEFFNVSLDYVKEKNISYSNFPEEWKDRELDFCKKYYDDTVKFTPFREDALNILKKLKNEGYKIYIITARNNSFYTDAFKTTKEELDYNGVTYDELVCTFDKAGFCAENGISLFVDDSIKNCEKVSEKGIKTFLFTSPVNKNTKTNLTRVENWTEVYEEIKKLGNDTPELILAMEI